MNLLANSQNPLTARAFSYGYDIKLLHERVFGKGPMCPTINGSGRVNAKLVQNPCIPFHPLIVEVGKKIISLTKDSRVSRRNDAFF